MRHLRGGCRRLIGYSVGAATTGGFRIVADGLGDRRAVALLETHIANSRAAGSIHALDLDGLRASDIRFWTIWEGGTLLGTGALKRLSAEHGELKSMHVAEAARRRGVGAAMLRHILAEAMAMTLARLSLETGSSAYFAPAHALYRRYGFAPCPPFGDYRPDPDSLFMTRAVAPDG